MRMRKWLCAILSACLLVTQIALAETPQMGVGEQTRRFMADNMEAVNDAQSYQQIGREVSEALGRGEDGLLKPGTRLLRLLTMPQGDELTGNHFEMPSGDWDKLIFMFVQGLMQYEVKGSLHMEPGQPLSGALDGTIEMDAGYDSDGCLAMDGSVLGTLVDTDGSVETQGDDMYARINQRTGEQRVKLPFMDELIAGQRAQEPESGGEMLINRLSQDATHWADALDVLYENLRNQPELLSLFRHWFEGGEASGDVTLTTGQLYQILGRALNDISADERFADALSQTALLDALYTDGALSFDPTAVSAMQRKFVLMGYLTVAAAEWNRQDKTGWPDGTLSVRADAVALDMTFGQDRYGDFSAKLDALLSRGADGAKLRVTLIDESGDATGVRGTHTARVDCAGDARTLLYNFVDSYGGDGWHLWLQTGDDGLEIEFGGDNDGDPCGNLRARKLDAADSYGIQGELGTRDRLYYRLDGVGGVNGGVASGQIALDCFRYEDSEPASMASVSYALGGGQIQLSAHLDNSEIMQTPTVLNVVLSGIKTDDELDLSARCEYNDGGSGLFLSMRGIAFHIDGVKRGSEWTGKLSLAAVVGTQVQEAVVSGDYALTQREDGGELDADLTVVNESLKIPVHVAASVGARSLSLLVSALENYKLALGANLDPDDLLLNCAVSVGALALVEIKLSSHLDDEQRRSALEVTQSGTSVQRVEIDSRVSPIESGYAFEHKLTAQPALGDLVSAVIDGEATSVLDMRSGSPLVMRQAASFGVETEYGAVTGEFELNHRFHVDERKHRAPKQPQRIEERIEPATPEPIPSPVEEPQESGADGLLTIEPEIIDG